MGGLGLVSRRRAIASSPTRSAYLRLDAEVLRVLIEKGVSADGIGVTEEDAARVTSISNWFNSNAIIQEFDSFKFFTSITVLGTWGSWNGITSPFSGCTSLVSLELPKSVNTLSYNSFYGCTNLVDVGDMSNVTRIGPSAFYNCEKLAIDVILPLLTLADQGAFAKSGVRRVLDLGKITSIIGNWNSSYALFANCKNLELAILPSTLTSIGIQSFLNCSNLHSLIVKAVTPPSLGDSALGNTSCKIYVPDNAVESYQSATGWKAVSSRILPISSFQTDHPSLYVEVQNYI